MLAELQGSVVITVFLVSPPGNCMITVAWHIALSGLCCGLPPFGRELSCLSCCWCMQ
jgi:hypothetical protein